LALKIGTGIARPVFFGGELDRAPGGDHQAFLTGRLTVASPPGATRRARNRQGSGFDEVPLLLPQTQGPVFTREIIHTGITRAVQDDPQTFVLGCNARVKRSSALAEHLGWPPAQE
jgi:hypothetical protein